MDAATQYALAYALTTSAGLRGVLTLAAVSFAVHAGWFHPFPQFAWLGSTAVTIALTAVAALDLAADKIPVVDHVLHVVGVVVKPACAAILVGGTLHPKNGHDLVPLMVLGAINALGIHAASATARGASTAFTGGLANPVVSVAEDGLSIGTIVLAFIAPVAAAILALVLTVLAIRGVTVAYRRARA